MAYDTETTKASLKFPDRETDHVMMISYLVDGQGYLITNREIVSEDFEDFEYTPMEGYEGPFMSQTKYAETIKRFFAHIQDVKRTVMITFNGDFFDFPFFDGRAKINGVEWSDMLKLIEVTLSCLMGMRRSMAISATVIFWNHLGGHVEALEARVFRSEIPTDFKITPSAVQELIDDLDAALTFFKTAIQSALEVLQDNPKRTDHHLIYHSDVAALYPNIISSNRLQPDSMVDESGCAVCDYNRPGKTCERWTWSITTRRI
ncbi:DNA polymerase family B, exonuclease domain-containing protein [Lentinula raphanica]|nr:DNA polymerase family B, exonuclease domain-containing protein [Lentinula raphanica]